MDKPADNSDAQRHPGPLMVSVFSGGGIGLMVGALLGLAMSPTVAAFVGAIGTALAALLGLNDKHFSAGKGLRIGAFGVLAVVGAVIGLYAKNYGLFAPSLQEKKESIMAAGFTECQALDLLAGLSLRLSPLENDSNLEDRKKALKTAGFSECQSLALLVGRSSGEAQGSGGQSESLIAKILAGHGLMTGIAEIKGCGILDMLIYDPALPLDDIHSSFSAAGDGWKRFFDSVSSADFTESEKRELLFIGRDAVCRTDELPSEPHCDRIRTALTSGSSLQDAFGEIDALRSVRDLVNKKIGSADDRETALGLLTRALCGRF